MNGALLPLPALFGFIPNETTGWELLLVCACLGTLSGNAKG